MSLEHIKYNLSFITSSLVLYNHKLAFDETLMKSIQPRDFVHGNAD